MGGLDPRSETMERPARMNGKTARDCKERSDVKERKALGGDLKGSDGVFFLYVRSMTSNNGLWSRMASSMIEICLLVDLATTLLSPLSQILTKDPLFAGTASMWTISRISITGSDRLGRQPVHEFVIIPSVDFSFNARVYDSMTDYLQANSTDM